VAQDVRLGDSSCFEFGQPLNDFAYFYVLELVGQLCHLTLTLADRREHRIMTQARLSVTLRIIMCLIS